MSSAPLKAALRADEIRAAVQHHTATLVRFVDASGAPAAWPEVAHRLYTDPAFSDAWIAAWRRDFDYQWKPVPIHPSTFDRPFFAVLVPASFPKADPSAFREQLDALGPTENVATFPSLGGDSTMVVPARRGAYGCLGEYSRSATAAEQRDLWSTVGRLASQLIELGQTCWCNTHGHAVPWLHLRFDPTHKYPAFSPRGAITAASQSEWYARWYDPAFGGKR
ncbi:MAG: hypothetical protein H6700_04610 [Myxococcales bacterium]|nr:hypothetical protein [Myxococcales bacterium]